jgi:hypothetical protein
MAIDGLSPVGGPENARSTPPAQGPDVAPLTAPPLEDESTFVPTGDLTELLRLARETVQLRQEVIGEAARRLAAGELFTRPAAEQAVQGILESRALTD